MKSAYPPGVRRRVLLYEIDEVPWEIIDLYVAARPRSHLADLLDRSVQLTTIDDDPVDLMPWRNWPTVHYSRRTTDHGSFDQGQDADTFQGTPLWLAADRAGRRVGVFAPLQSWPPRPLRSGGFYVPDCFARTPETVPRTLERFQAFNLQMTADNSFAAEHRLGPTDVARVGADLLANGMTPWSVSRAVRHLLRERIDSRHMASRPTVQVLPSFDLFWHLHRRHRPDLSIFFTGHVASMMHRFWGDWVPGYAAEYGYTPDPIYRTFILTAMDYVDHHVSRMRRWVHRNPGAVLLLASGMGQGPIRYHEMAATYVLEDAGRLVAALGFDEGEAGSAMYPRITIQFPDTNGAEAATTAVRSVTVASGPMFRDLRRMGTTLSFEIVAQFDATSLDDTVRWVPDGGSHRSGTLGDLGISVRSRPGGGNTAQHTPEGTLIACGPGIHHDARREKVSVLDLSPSILRLLDVDPTPDMRGEPALVNRLA